MRRTVTRMVRGMSRFRFSAVMAIGAMTPVRPRMRRVLRMLEPTTFPMEMSAIPLNAQNLQPN